MQGKAAVPLPQHLDRTLSLTHGPHCLGRVERRHEGRGERYRRSEKQFGHPTGHYVPSLRSTFRSHNIFCRSRRGMRYRRKYSAVFPTKTFGARNNSPPHTSPETKIFLNRFPTKLICAGGVAFAVSTTEINPRSVGSLRGEPRVRNSESHVGNGRSRA